MSENIGKLTLSYLLDRTVRTDTGCLVWQGMRTDRGYGRAYTNGRGSARVRAHRAVYYLTHGEWPLVCRHKCDNPPCINPDHLEDGTHADNQRDRAERNTHCKYGHPLTADNVAWYANKRYCRMCDQARSRAKRERRRIRNGDAGASP
jgi:hypothetical protein